MLKIKVNLKFLRSRSNTRWSVRRRRSTPPCERNQSSDPVNCLRPTVVFWGMFFFELWNCYQGLEVIDQWPYGVQYKAIPYNIQFMQYHAIYNSCNTMQYDAIFIMVIFVINLSPLNSCWDFFCRSRIIDVVWNFSSSYSWSSSPGTTLCKVYPWLTWCNRVGNQDKTSRNRIKQNGWTHLLFLVGLVLGLTVLNFNKSKWVRWQIIGMLELDTDYCWTFALGCSWYLVLGTWNLDLVLGPIVDTF